MRKRGRRRLRARWRRALLVALSVAYCVGAFWVAWVIFRHASGAQAEPARERVVSRLEPAPARPGARTEERTESATRPLELSPGEEADAVEELRARYLRLPVEGEQAKDMRESFEETRGGHAHEAIDIFAGRGTPVVAVEDGRIARLFWSKAGGLTIYHFDPTERYAYYYAHLDRYAEGLRDDDRVTRGQVIGYVGTSGNAPPGTPHLHFAIFKLGPEKRWWEGTAIDPFLVLAVDGSPPH